MLLLPPLALLLAALAPPELLDIVELPEELAPPLPEELPLCSVDPPPLLLPEPELQAQAPRIRKNANPWPAINVLSLCGVSIPMQ